MRIEDRSISRRHAVLHLGRTLLLEALQSANGTRVRGEVLPPGERAALEPGDAFALGGLTCIVDGRAATERPRRLWTHGYFEGRLEDECARAAEAGGGFAVLHARVDGRADPDFAAELLACFRPEDIVAVYVPGEYEVLRRDATPESARGLAEAASARLARQGRTVRVVAACYPQDGRGPEALLAVVRGALARGAAPSPPAGVVVADESMRRLHARIDQVARGVISVLLLGEPGVGKEVFAERLQARSPRASKPFVRFNCAAFAEALVESELFGHEKAAFTGAAAARQGLLESAEGGTVFLDEVGDLPLAVHAKLLRVLETRRFRRVGGTQERALDVRFVAATNRDLEAEVAAGRFRADLYFRLNGISLEIPPLRARPSEVEPLARRFVALAAAQNGLTEPPELSAQALSALRRYTWPGNVRELRNMMDRAVLLAWDVPITPEHLPMDKMALVVDAVPAAPAPPPAEEASAPGAIERVRDDAERRCIVEALARCHGHQANAAALLGISRRTMINKIERYGLPRPRKGAAGQGGAAGDDG